MFEIDFGINFPTTQSQGRELGKKDTWRRHWHHNKRLHASFQALGGFVCELQRR